MNGQLFVAVLVVAIVGTRANVLEDEYLNKKDDFVNDKFVLFKAAIEGGHSGDFDNLLNTALISQLEAASGNSSEIYSKIKEIQNCLPYINEDSKYYGIAVKQLEDHLNTELINLLHGYCYNLDTAQELIVKVLNKTNFPSELEFVKYRLVIAKAKIIDLLKAAKDTLSNVSLAVKAKNENWPPNSHLASGIKEEVENAVSKMTQQLSAFPSAKANLISLKGALVKEIAQ